MDLDLDKNVYVTKAELFPTSGNDDIPIIESLGFLYKSTTELEHNKKYLNIVKEYPISSSSSHNLGKLYFNHKLINKGKNGYYKVATMDHKVIKWDPEFISKLQYTINKSGALGLIHLKLDIDSKYGPLTKKAFQMYLNKIREKVISENPESENIPEPLFIDGLPGNKTFTLLGVIMSLTLNKDYYFDGDYIKMFEGLKTFINNQIKDLPSNFDDYINIISGEVKRILDYDNFNDPEKSLGFKKVVKLKELMPGYLSSFEYEKLIDAVDAVDAVYLS